MFPGEVNIAVLDDEAKFRQAITRLLRSHGFKVESFGTGSELLTALTLRSFDCVLLDLHMPEVTGFDVLSQMTQRQANAPVIVITGHDEPGNAERVYNLGAANYMLKPVDEMSLLEAINKAIPALQFTNKNR